MSLKLCSKCSLHYHGVEKTCPHCSLPTRARGTGMGLALLLGISLSACEGKAVDTADTAGSGDTAETGDITPEPSEEEDYGVPETDNTGDVWMGED